MKVVLLGPPGAGKGTQAAHICRHFNITSLSTGDIFRSVAQSDDTLGRKVQAIISRGELVPDALVNDVVLSKLTAETLASGFVLDGFPRTVAQASVLQHFLTENRTCLNFVIDIEVDHEILFGRIQSRVAQSGGNVRHDDNEQVLKNRITVYNELTKPLLSFYRDLGLLVSINGMKTVDEVTSDIVSVLSKK